ncbi:MAG: hypothetical protein QXY49_03005 [Thermofilaceae archaeon]
MKKREPVELKVKDLRPSSKWFTVKVKILNMGDEKNVFSRDGSQHRVAEALVGDETGSILLTLWDNDIDKVRGLIGSTVAVKNGYIVLFRGSMRLALGRFGSLEEVDEEITDVNEELNMSEKMYSQRGSFRSRRPRGEF